MWASLVECATNSRTLPGSEYQPSELPTPRYRCQMTSMRTQAAPELFSLRRLGFYAHLVT